MVTSLAHQSAGKARPSWEGSSLLHIAPAEAIHLEPGGSASQTSPFCGWPVCAAEDWQRPFLSMQTCTWTLPRLPGLPHSMVAGLKDLVSQRREVEAASF